MFKHFQFSTIHQSLELVLKAKDIFIKLNNTLILPRVEGRDVLDSLKGLFCSPPPGSTVSHQELVQLLLNASSQRSDAQEVPQSDSFWKDTRGEIDKARNENIP